ncbi:hypothetical protein NE237_015406 [Protea cynaroides]|uniref:TF-B3 domain-containing protein n=1 Tax=Protea cynaroides TaxID=273540 RepID=A0A9Q0KE03_9MAGN|nr:hypothetical protein NE237_015406 [Protea cynaroides]
MGTRPTYSFFKILPADFTEELKIPPAFAKQLDGKLPGEFLLRSHTEKSWSVKVENIAKDTFFRHGWQTFVMDHSLESGDFIVFNYIGNSHFYVQIFGRHGCEKHVRFSSERNYGKEKAMESYQQTTSRRINPASVLFDKDRDIQFNENKLKMPKAHEVEADCFEKESRDGQDKNPNTPANYPPGTHETRMKFVAQGARDFKSHYPFFQVKISQTYARSGCVNIESNFVKCFLKDGRQDVRLQLSDGRNWTVNCIRKRNVGVITRGWKEFIKNNNVQEGNICAFELIEKKDILLRVSIFSG